MSQDSTLCYMLYDLTILSATFHARTWPSPLFSFVRHVPSLPQHSPADFPRLISKGGIDYAVPYVGFWANRVWMILWFIYIFSAVAIAILMQLTMFVSPPFPLNFRNFFLTQSHISLQARSITCISDYHSC